MKLQINIVNNILKYDALNGCKVCVFNNLNLDEIYLNGFIQIFIYSKL